MPLVALIYLLPVAVEANQRSFFYFLKLRRLKIQALGVRIKVIIGLSLHGRILLVLLLQTRVQLVLRQYPLWIRSIHFVSSKSGNDQLGIFLGYPPPLVLYHLERLHVLVELRVTP